MAIFNFNFGKGKKRREQEEAMRNWYQELQNIQAFQNNVLGPAAQGTGILPGMDSITAGINSGAVPIDPSGAGVQDMMRFGRALPVPPAILADNPVYSQIAVDLYNQAMGADPAILEQERRAEIAKEILRASGQKVDQNLLGLDELEKTAKNPSLLTRERILQNLGEKEFASTTGTESAKEPFRDIAMQREIAKSRLLRKEKGGGDGGGGGFNVPQDFLNRTEKEILRDKTGVYVTVPEQQSAFTPEDIKNNPALLLVDERIKEKPALTDRGLRVMQIAEELAAQSKNRQPLSIINEAKAQEKKEFAEQQKAQKSAIQGAQRPGIQINPNPAPQVNRFPGKYPRVQNEDGSTSNVKLGGFEIDGRTYVIPTMVNGKQLTPDEAVAIAKQQGLDKYPSFATQQEADNYAESIHSQVDEQGRIGRTRRDPATENKIRVLRQKGITPEQIKQALKEEGKNPADYGY